MPIENWKDQISFMCGCSHVHTQPSINKYPPCVKLTVYNENVLNICSHFLLFTEAYQSSDVTHLQS